MTVDLIDKSTYPDWKQSHQWNTCLLNREQYGKFLINYLIEEKSGYVLNIDSRWGSGKTEMLKRLYVEAMARRHPCVFIDAWISDFSNAPLQVVSSELVTQLSALNGDVNKIFDKIKTVLGKFLKGAAIGAAGLVSKATLGEASAGADAVKELLAQEPKDFLAAITSDFNEQIHAMNSIKSELQALGEVLKANLGCQLPIFVFVDELDRCRPNYAVEMLESIKHFFDVPGFVFVVATDTEQITHAIKVIYGNSFNSDGYLHRFFNRRASIPLPKNDQYLNIKLSENELCDLKNVETHPSINNEEVSKIIALIGETYELQLRDFDQLIDRIKSCLRNIKLFNGYKILINLTALTILLIEYSHFRKEYEERKINPNIEPTILLGKSVYGIQASTLINNCLQTTVKQDINYNQNSSQGYPGRETFNSMIGSSAPYTTFYQQLINYSEAKKYNQRSYTFQDYRNLVEMAIEIQ